MMLSLNNGSSAVHTGYGHASMRIMTNIGKTHHNILLNRAADLEFNFCHPNFYTWNSSTSFKVGYTAWESTSIKEGWQDQIDKVHEMWVPNQFCKDIFSQYTDKDIYIFPHGVDSGFSPHKRTPGKVLRFLHIGYPAYRKNAHDVINTFLELYAGRTDVHLTIKGYLGYDLDVKEDNITYISENYTYAEMKQLMMDHDVLLYPSWGEGFGLIPLQALATGMPVIMTDGWCDYKHYVPELIIKSELKYNPWQDTHPGKMFKPDINHFAELIGHTEKNIDSILEKQYDRAFLLHEEYSWEKVVADHFNSVESRLMI